MHLLKLGLIAGDFILKNKSQIEKRLKSRKHIKNPVEVFVYDDSNIKEADINKAKTVDKIIESIYQKNPNDKILLIGRYNRDIYSLKNDYLFTLRGDKVTSKKNPKAKLSFLTIHKAKGLGYDQCILLNLSDDTYGFPSRIEDEPIVKLIKPKNKENIDYPEERRLFYVALTRTKKRVSLLVPKSKASSFAEEIGNYANVSVHYINW
jgi:DNA helicase-4